MEYTAKAVLTACPNCLGRDGDLNVHLRFFFVRQARVVCPCGVSGPCVDVTTGTTPWNAAAQGWNWIMGPRPLRLEPVFQTCRDHEGQPA